MMHYLQQKLAYYSWAPLVKGQSSGRQQTIQESVARQQQQREQQEQQHKQQPHGDASATRSQHGSMPATQVLPVAAATAGLSVGCVSRIQPFPQQAHLPCAAVSNTYVTKQLQEISEQDRQYTRSVIEHAASSATILSADFQHYPTKMVHTPDGRAANAIFNLMDVKTGTHGNMLRVCQQLVQVFLAHSYVTACMCQQ